MQRYQYLPVSIGLYIWYFYTDKFLYQ